jgi:PPOX class probable F420-dependent enzyme
MTDLTPFANQVPRDHGLSVVVTRRADHSPHTTVVNAGVLPHPVSADDVIAFVSAGGTRKLTQLRADSTIAVVIRAGWEWVAAEGAAQLIGPDDPHPDVDDERHRALLRDIFTAAGGTHHDWATYDRVMREERRTAVLVRPTRLYSNAT